MSVANLPPSRRPVDPERRARILAAAERAFAAHGFHAATMQHVAEAAGMSAGNLYRYFPSKEAIVAGLCGRDQDQRVGAFAELMAGDSVLAAFDKGLRDHVALRSRDKAVMIVEIWAEAARNPQIARLTRAIDVDVLGHLTRMIEVAKQRGEAASGVDAEAAARIIFTYVGGLFKRIALNPDFDVQGALDEALALFRALFAGALALGAARPDREAR
jgi:TetR/AcrR family transcriptional regulator, repressor for uid operon